ncbi:hypothetical protein [Halovivax cerinus]|uniref:Uncharacterized protein n=1 Tax=Halovivax cerinus TaxID=1487865 RepID=A0ABD5NKI8_9EURY|nr:hypothetical protein [Halovivax cerinus]
MTLAPEERNDAAGYAHHATPDHVEKLDEELPFDEGKFSDDDGEEPIVTRNFGPGADRFFPLSSALTANTDDEHTPHY